MRANKIGLKITLSTTKLKTDFNLTFSHFIINNLSIIYRKRAIDI